MTLWRVDVQRPTVEGTVIFCQAPDKEAAIEEALRMIEFDDCDTPFGQAEWHEIESYNGELTVTRIQEING